MIRRKHKAGIDFEMVKQKRNCDPQSLLLKSIKRNWKENDRV